VQKRPEGALEGHIADLMTVCDIAHFAYFVCVLGAILFSVEM